MAARIPSFTEDDKEVLVSIVKTAQQRKLKGKCGSWKEFLMLQTRNSTYDPAKHSWQILSQFLSTLTDEKDIQMVHRMKSWKEQPKQPELAAAWPDTPEQALVNLTLQNPRFSKEYDFPSFQHGWISVESGNPSDASNPERLLSIDCEMVKCVNDEQNVVQVCIVDRNYKPLLDTLVRPNKKVVDYLTEIHGISAAEMENASCTQEEAQMKVKELLTPGTILVGHSLYHDLRALKIDYRRVIDTTMMFKHNGSHIGFSMGLNTLSQAILGYGFRDDQKVHKCIDDAIVPMKIILHELQHGPSDPLGLKGYAGKEDRLFIHKIPAAIQNADIKKMFSMECKIEKTRGKTAQAYAVFESCEAADNAFNGLAGELQKDAVGRDQKVVKFKHNRMTFEVRVRKNCVASTTLPSKREAPEPLQSPVAKKPKCACDQAEEVQRLQKLLEARDGEIVALKKLIVNMENKQ